MTDYRSSMTVDEWIALGVNPDTGEIADNRSNEDSGGEEGGTDGQNFTRTRVTDSPQWSRKTFNKLFDLGAHAMLDMPVCKLTKTMAVLMRDSTYRGISYATPATVGAEIGVDDRYARRLLKQVEDCGFAMKIKTQSGYYYLLNPNYCFSGNEKEERVAKAIWARERTKRLEVKSKARRPGKKEASR